MSLPPKIEQNEHDSSETISLAFFLCAVNGSQVEFHFSEWIVFQVDIGFGFFNAVIQLFSLDLLNFPFFYKFTILRGRIVIMFEFILI